MNITLSLKYTRRVTGINKQGPYDFISIPARTDDGKWAELTMTPLEYDGVTGSFGVLDEVSFSNAVIEPRKDGALDRNGNPRLIVSKFNWKDANIERSPLKSTMPSLETLTRFASERAQTTARMAENPIIGEGAIL